MWQIGFSFNCNNPAFCSEGAGGDWGWIELDRSADGTQTWGDAQSSFCFHTVGGGGAGAGHSSVEIESWFIAPGSAGPKTFFASESESNGYGKGRATRNPASASNVERPARGYCGLTGAK